MKNKEYIYTTVIHASKRVINGGIHERTSYDLMIKWLVEDLMDLDFAHLRIRIEYD